MSLITIEEFETLTNASFSGYPTEYIEAVLDAVSDDLERKWSTKFKETEIADEMDTNSYVTRHGWLKVHCKYAPVISVSGLKYQFAGSTQEIDIANADIDKQMGVISVLWYRPLWGGPDRWITLVSYKAGYTIIPMWIKMAVALLAWEDILANERAGGGGLPYPLAGYKVGSYSENYAVRQVASGSDLGLGTELSLRAKALALPHRRAGVV